MDVKQAPSEDAIVLSYSWILNVVISFISSYHPQTLFILNASIPALISPASFHLPPSLGSFLTATYLHMESHLLPPLSLYTYTVGLHGLSPLIRFPNTSLTHFAHLL